MDFLRVCGRYRLRVPTRCPHPTRVRTPRGGQDLATHPPGAPHPRSGQQGPRSPCHLPRLFESGLLCILPETWVGLPHTWGRLGGRSGVGAGPVVRPRALQGSLGRGRPRVQAIPGPQRLNEAGEDSKAGTLQPGWGEYWACGVLREGTPLGRPTQRYPGEYKPGSLPPREPRPERLDRPPLALADTQGACVPRNRLPARGNPWGHVWVLAHRGTPGKLGQLCDPQEPPGQDGSHAQPPHTPDTGRETMGGRARPAPKGADGEGV